MFKRFIFSLCDTIRKFFKWFEKEQLIQLTDSKKPTF